ncbi:DUF3592 domain-containing protein [Streptomyces yokosukanensis]|uniref:DUF3592 domain-containing protein n=1 Tax=Streptomyces yokosukanensis TaxID=67386 RepID=UPI003412F7D6
MKSLLLYLTGVAGPMFLMVAGLEVRNQRRLRREGSRTSGTVVRHEQDFTEDDAYYPVVAFTAADGQRYECRSAYSGRRHYPVGRVVPVLYLPGSPSNSVIDMRAQRWSRFIVLVLVGGAFTATFVKYVLLR